MKFIIIIITIAFCFSTLSMETNKAIDCVNGTSECPTDEKEIRQVYDTVMSYVFTIVGSFESSVATREEAKGLAQRASLFLYQKL